MENLEIKSNKEFMNALLLGEMFDDFLLKEAYVKNRGYLPYRRTH